MIAPLIWYGSRHGLLGFVCVANEPVPDLQVRLKPLTCDSQTICYPVFVSTLQEIESAIERLSDSEVAELKAWIWDRDIESDVVEGRLDSLADKALREHRAGKIRPL